ncbi:PREDICTED: myb family transcription factor APL-like isoform X1 [Brassica oleracea var. oleracea]|uniref:myb family transcription factor APL-like isoform X1 n=1 Tax=Brassica oleracea var. oleracea TaxID=109376 RepID=UPI0006A6D1EC|nr:PREDICTED: myb family transcription factor APL-like isoform X1 [Brassica oleracea var. oleracea]
MDNDKNHKTEEPKPRLRWSYELHHRFINAVNQLGGPNKATPKGLMRVLEIPELTLYHLKSYLQKYRLGISERFIGNKQDAGRSQECQSREDFGDQLDIIVTEEKHDEPNNRNLQNKEAMEIQMEVQKKLHEQIETQQQLQVRIEAQGKYLQSVLLKAQETLSGYNSFNLYAVASMANRNCLSSSFSAPTQADEDNEVEEEYDFLCTKKPENRGNASTRSSVDCSLASSESSEAKQDHHSQNNMRRSDKLQFMEIKPEEVMDRNKRRWDDVLCVEQSNRKRSFKGHDGEDLGLGLNSFKVMETSYKSKSKSKSNK